eukprot:1373190-Amorphochlora_amoeboformis.AAC.1
MFSAIAECYRALGQEQQEPDWVLLRVLQNCRVVVFRKGTLEAHRSPSEVVRPAVATQPVQSRACAPWPTIISFRTSREVDVDVMSLGIDDLDVITKRI